MSLLSGFLSLVYRPINHTMGITPTVEKREKNCPHGPPVKARTTFPKILPTFSALRKFQSTASVYSVLAKYHATCIKTKNWSRIQSQFSQPYFPLSSLSDNGCESPAPRGEQLFPAHAEIPRPEEGAEQEPHTAAPSLGEIAQRLAVLEEQPHRG